MFLSKRHRKNNQFANAFSDIIYKTGNVNTIVTSAPIPMFSPEPVRVKVLASEPLSKQEPVHLPVHVLPQEPAHLPESKHLPNQEKESTLRKKNKSEKIKLNNVKFSENVKFN
jgi:hypothetical protein